MDVEAEERRAEVQKKKYVHGNSRQAGVCSHRLRLLVSLAAYAIARSGACTRGSLAVIAIITCALAGCAVSIKSVGAVIHARLLAVFFKLPSHEGGLKSRGLMALSKRFPQTNLMQSDSSPETMLPLGVEILPALVTRYPQK